MWTTLLGKKTLFIDSSSNLIIAVILIEICMMGPGTHGVGNQWVLWTFNGSKRIVMAETRSTEKGGGGLAFKVSVHMEP